MRVVKTVCEGREETSPPVGDWHKNPLARAQVLNGLFANHRGVFTVQRVRFRSGTKFSPIVFDFFMGAVMRASSGGRKLARLYVMQLIQLLTQINNELNEFTEIIIYINL